MRPLHESHQPPRVSVSADLFAWQSGRIVLLGERAGGGWILARGWRTVDRLTDVRRWTFATPERFIAQVHRLASEAVANPTCAGDAARAAADWIAVYACPAPRGDAAADS